MYGPFLAGLGLEGSESEDLGATIFTADDAGLAKKAMVAVDVVDGRQERCVPLADAS